MKKIICFIVLLLAFVLPIKVFALSGTITLECDDFTKKVGETISCTLYGNSDELVSAVESKIVNAEGLNLSSVTVPSIWQGDYENESILLYTDTNKSGKFEVLKFNVTSSQVGEKNLTFEDTYFTDSSFVRNVILNPNYKFKFISDEESQQIDDETNADIVPDNNNGSENSSEEDIENPGSGSFIPLVSILVLSTISAFIYFKVRNKKFI